MALDLTLVGLTPAPGVQLDLFSPTAERLKLEGALAMLADTEQQSLVRSRPACLEDLVVQVALIRPGPIQGNMVHPYLRRRQGLEPVAYLHPLLEPILRETLGVVVFQEQVIRIAMAMGRFSAGEADLLRRAMTRHTGEGTVASFRERFIAGRRRSGGRARAGRRDL